MKNKELSKKIVIKIKDILLWISKILVFVVVGLMIFVPFLTKNMSFKDDDVIVYNKKISVISLDSKVNVQIVNTYFKTTIDYNKYDNYIKSYNTSSYSKKVLVLEVLLLFMLLEVIFIYYIIKNIDKMLIEKEPNEYSLYCVKKAYIINVISVLTISFLRKFIFRNTIFASFDVSTCSIYLFTIIMFIVIYRVIMQNRVTISKRKSYDKN